MIEVKFVVLTDTATFTLTMIDPFGSLLVKRKSDGFIAFVDEVTDVLFWKVLKDVALLEDYERNLTFVNPNE
jgi:hypothetical protein